MTTIATALTSLGITEWVYRGADATTEAEFNQRFRKIMGADENGTGIESADPKDWGTTWKAVSDKKTELVNAEPMRLLRVERDRLLAETDWMANSDVTLADNWKTYRQSLRDLPASASPKLSANGSLDMSSVTFPTKPS
tara:strand:- start:1435 stop:1851 length:417 start_codon:yes stop_codon:yes gene_type:complete